MKFSDFVSLFTLHAITTSAIPTGDIMEDSGLSYDDSQPLRKRACWHGAMWGWTDEHCWKRCNTNNLSAGHWCWLASDRGRGPWARCLGSSVQCGNWCRDMALWPEVYDCGVGDCAACGCSC